VAPFKKGEGPKTSRETKQKGGERAAEETERSRKVKNPREYVDEQEADRLRDRTGRN